MARTSVIVCLVGFVGIGIGGIAFSQQVQVTTPQATVSDSFYERFGTNWGFSLGDRNGWLFFNRGGGSSAWPPFGGFNPANQAQFGYGLRGGNGNLFFGLQAAQGSRRSFTSSTPTVVLPNGGVGGVWDTTWRPFVTGLVPVVGYGGVLPPARWVSPLKERVARLKHQATMGGDTLTPTGAETEPLILGSRPADERASFQTPHPRYSTAQHGDISVAEIRQQQQLEANRRAHDLEGLISQAESAVKVGRFGEARVAYRRAAERASGSRKQELLQRLASLRPKTEDEAGRE